jgi:hypothetical protein
MSRVALGLALGSLLAAAPILAAPAKKVQKRPPPKAQKGKKKSTPSGPPLPPPAVLLRGIDLAAGHALVDVAGSARAPEARIFTLTDERERHYLPHLVECHPQPVEPDQAGADKGSLSASTGPAVPPPPAGRWRCSLEIPRIYQRSALVGLSVQLRGQTIAVPRERVQAAWAEARAMTPLPAAERPRRPGTPWPAARRGPDAGPAPDPVEVDSDSEE